MMVPKGKEADCPGQAPSTTGKKLDDKDNNTVSKPSGPDGSCKTDKECGQGIRCGQLVLADGTKKPRICYQESKCGNKDNNGNWINCVGTQDEDPKKKKTVSGKKVEAKGKADKD